MSKLIAMVATAVIINGERTVIQPGAELPELPAHDERELTASGAAKNPDDEAALAKADKRTAAKADAEFEQARQRVQQADASIAEPAAAPVKPAAKK